MLDEFGRVITRPFREEIETSTIILYVVIYIIAAWVIYDVLRILTQWIAEAS